LNINSSYNHNSIKLCTIINSCKYAFNALIIVILTSGIFFIRDDWPFGFNGSYLVVIGLLISTIYTSLYTYSKMSLPKLGLYSGVFLTWFSVSVLNITIFSIINENLSPSIFLIQEFAFISLIYFTGYIAVKLMKFSPLQIYLITSIWILVSSFAMLESLLTGDAVRRIKALASVNYMSSSFGAFFIMSLGTLILSDNQSLSKKTYLLLVLFLSFMGVILSGTRSIMLGLIIVLSLWIFYFLWKKYLTLRLSKRELLSVMSLVLIVLLSMVGLYWFLKDIDVTSLFRRFDSSVLVEAGEQRILGRALAGIPLYLQDIIIGNPSIYPLFQSGQLHPHNILISTWRFTGLLPFVLLTGFIFLLFSYRIYVKKRLLTKRERVELFIIVSAFGIIFTYTMFSGHFTRNWHFFWTAGLLSAYLEGIKKKQIIESR